MHGSNCDPRVKGACMKKAVMVIAQDKFRDEELFEPKAILEQAGVTVEVASTSLSPALGMLGAQVKPDLLVKDINVFEYDAIVFIGGMGASQYWNDPVAHKLIWDAQSAGKLIAAICIAPVTLAKAGLLKGKKATVWASDAGQLLVAGVRYTGNNVEIDGNIITAAGPFAAREFAQALIQALASKQKGTV